MRRQGFTLLEVIIAIAVTAFIGVTLGMAFSTTSTAKETMEAQTEKYRMLRGAMNRLEREISAAYISDRYDAKKYRDQYDRPTNFIGAKDKLMFTSMAHQRLYADAKESDQMVVEYSVKQATDRNVHGRNDLMRREKPLIEDKMERGGVEEAVFEGIKRIEFHYWDSDKKEWVDEWDTRRLERKTILPTRVKFTIVALDENNKEQKYTSQARVMLNTEFPRFQ